MSTNNFQKVAMAAIAVTFLTISFAGCSKDKNPLDGSLAKLSPPSWIQGVWAADEAGQYPMYKFTSDDILLAVSFSFEQSISLKLLYQSTAKYGVSWTVKETSTGSLYEVTFTGKVAGETGKHIYSFKKGDGTFMEAGITEDGEPVEDYDTLYKVK